MNEECYRLLIFRYVLLLSIGCYLALYDELKSTHKLIISIISCIIGFTFILSYFYLGYEPIILRYWTKTSILAVLYIIPFICLFIRKGKVVKFFPLEIIGKASYHIFLTQMLWYSGGLKKLSSKLENRFLLLLASVFICLIVGTIFHFVENPISNKINKITNTNHLK